MQLHHVVEYNLFADVVPTSVAVVKMGAMVVGVLCILPVALVASVGRCLCRHVRW
jgi:hypothetical protein